MTPWLEDKFVQSLEMTITRMRGHTDKIENRKHPGNSDLLYSLDRMGVIEAKATKEFKEHCKIRLKHPLTADQRRFLRNHGSRSGLAFCAVMLSQGNVKMNEVLLFRYDEIVFLDQVPLTEARGRCSWAGRWPPGGPADWERLRMVLNGVRA